MTEIAQSSARRAPIVLFVYNRPIHARRTLESLSRNALANESDLIIYSDGARTSAAKDAVNEVRAYLRTINLGFRSITIVERPRNVGLARSIISGVSEVLASQDRVIVLEDDMVTSPHFLTFMNEALERYAGEDRVASVHGYVYPVGQVLPETFFLQGADCWGWATWRRGWAIFQEDGIKLLAELKRRQMVGAFDHNGAYPFSRMLEQQIKGKNDSWAVRWYASTFLAGKLTLYPGRTLVQNIGTDGTGTHCGTTNRMDNDPTPDPVQIAPIPIEVSDAGRRAIEAFLRQQHVSIRERLSRFLASTRH